MRWAPDINAISVIEIERNRTTLKTLLRTETRSSIHSWAGIVVLCPWCIAGLAKTSLQSLLTSLGFAKVSPIFSPLYSTSVVVCNFEWLDALIFKSREFIDSPALEAKGLFIVALYIGWIRECYWTELLSRIFASSFTIQLCTTMPQERRSQIRTANWCFISGYWPHDSRGTERYGGWHSGV